MKQERIKAAEKVLALANEMLPRPEAERPVGLTDEVIHGAIRYCQAQLDELNDRSE